MTRQMLKFYDNDIRAMAAKGRHYTEIARALSFKPTSLYKYMADKGIESGPVPGKVKA